MKWAPKQWTQLIGVFKISEKTIHTIQLWTRDILHILKSKIVNFHISDSILESTDWNIVGNTVRELLTTNISPQNILPFIFKSDQIVEIWPQMCNLRWGSQEIKTIQHLPLLTGCYSRFIIKITVTEIIKGKKILTKIWHEEKSCDFPTNYRNVGITRHCLLNWKIGHFSRKT